MMRSTLIGILMMGAAALGQDKPPDKPQDPQPEQPDKPKPPGPRKPEACDLKVIKEQQFCD